MKDHEVRNNCIEYIYLEKHSLLRATQLNMKTKELDVPLDLISSIP